MSSIFLKTNNTALQKKIKHSFKRKGWSEGLGISKNFETVKLFILLISTKYQVTC